MKSSEAGLECLWKNRVKLYRWNDGQWKERGVGNAKLLRDKADKKVSFRMRQEKTLKPIANHLGKLITTTEVQVPLLFMQAYANVDV